MAKGKKEAIESKNGTAATPGDGAGQQVAEPPEVARASAYEVAQRQLDEVAGFWGLRTMSSAICALSWHRGLIVHFPVRADDDRVGGSSGDFRVHHNTAKEANQRGGIRYHPM